MEWLKPFNTKKELDKNCMDLLTHFVENKAKEEIRDFVENDEPFDDELFYEYWDMFDEDEYIAGRYDKLYNWYYCLEKVSKENVYKETAIIDGLITQNIYSWRFLGFPSIRELMKLTYKSILSQYYRDWEGHFRRIRNDIIDDYRKSMTE